MITIDQIKPGTDVIHTKTGKTTTVLTGHYEEPDLCTMIKTSAFPGGMPLSHFELPKAETGIAVKEQAAIVFKGKLVGDLEETVITPELIREKSKSLLALKINGIFDTEGAEKVKEAINKSIKMRTAVEKQADPIIKAINAKAKKDVQIVKDLAQPIYDACLATQNALQLTYDTWATEVEKAKQKEANEFKAKTEARESAMYSLGLIFNGVSFVGYGKPWMSKESLYSMPENTYNGVVEELEALQMEAGVTGKENEKPIFAIPNQSVEDGYKLPTIEYVNGNEKWPTEIKLFDNQIYSCMVGEYTFVLTKGQVNTIDGQIIANDRVTDSVCCQVIKR